MNDLARPGAETQSHRVGGAYLTLDLPMAPVLIVRGKDGNPYLLNDVITP